MPVKCQGPSRRDRLSLPQSLRAVKLTGVTPDTPVDVSIVLPVFNEAGHLAAEVRRIREAMDQSSYRYEILVIDDGSTDGGMSELAGMEGIRMVAFDQNRGSGAARRAGTLMARGDVVVWTDADMSYPNNRIPELVDLLPGWDMVVGARKTEGGSFKLARVPMKWAIRILASFLAMTKIPDLNSGYRAFRRVVAGQYLHLLPMGFSCVTTLTMSFLSNGYSVRYTPIDYAPRAGHSKFHWWKDTALYLRQVVRMVLLWNPLRFFAPFGVTLGLVGFAKLVYDVVTKDFRVATNTVTLLLSAAVLLLMALGADLLVQLNRPRDLVLPATSAHQDRHDD